MLVLLTVTISPPIDISPCTSRVVALTSIVVAVKSISSVAPKLNTVALEP